jgi:prephenate dehydrogenase
MKIGIIGFGRLGKLIVKNLAQDFDLLVYDKVDFSSEIKDYNAIPATLEEVCKAKIVIPFVPISEFENVIKEIKDLLTKNSLIIDVCSVKIHPIEVMEKYLPKNIQILGTHPMFGPDSAKTTLMGSKIVLCKRRVDDDLYSAIKSYLQKFGLKVIEATADRHDKEISHSLLLTHFVGRTLIDFKAGELEIDTAGYRRLMKILGTVENDTWQLFEDMNNYNPHAKDTISDFIKSQDSIIERLKR